MLEVPFLDEIVMEKTRETACQTAQRAIMTVLETRLGELPPDLVEEIESVDDEERLEALTRSAAACPDLDAFRRAMARS